MHWEDEYKKNKRLWGEGPSELARAAVDYLIEHASNKSKDDALNILDVGCGYGRDAIYYARNLACNVMGIDISAKAIEIASDTPIENAIGSTSFQQRDLADTATDQYDIVCASNLYQILKQDERAALRNAVMQVLKPGGLFFLSTLSVDDPEHYAEGTPIEGEPNSYSFTHKLYLHFCTGEELREDFGSLDIIDLYEREYDEPRADGNEHHHISWILIAIKSAE